MTFDIPALKESLSHVYWICGAPCAGKTAVAGLLARRLDLILYSTDQEALSRHFPLSTAERQPAMARARSLWDSYYDREPDRIVSESIAYMREQFEMVVEDLLRLPREKPVIAEGICLLPELVNPLTDYVRALCLIPSRSFYGVHQLVRPAIEERLRLSPDPEAATRNMILAHGDMADFLLQSARRVGMKILTADGWDPLEGNLEKVREHFRL